MSRKCQSLGTIKVCMLMFLWSLAVKILEEKEIYIYINLYCDWTTLKVYTELSEEITNFHRMNSDKKKTILRSPALV